jgi:hypothetical protein
MNKNIKNSSRTKNIELLNQTTNTSYASVESSPDSFIDNNSTTFSYVKTSIEVEEDDIVFLSEEVKEKEREIYNAGPKVDFSDKNVDFSNPPVNSRNANGIFTIVDDIDPGIHIYDQDTSGTCSAQSVCFLYIYTMAIGVNHSLNDVTWWDFAKSSDAPPLANAIIDWLQRLFKKLDITIDYTRSFRANLNYAMGEALIRNNINFYLDHAIFSRTFMMWAGYYSLYWPDNVNLDYFPYRDGGSGPGYILNGLEKFGAIITDPVVLPRP